MALQKKRVAPFTAAPTPALSNQPFELGGKQFTIKRQVTLPVWPWSDGETKVFEMLEKIHESRSFSADKEALKRDSEKPLGPARIAHVKDLVTGNLYTMIFGVALEREITEAFPDDSYIGQAFKVTRFPARKTKRGFNVNPYAVSVVEEA